MVATLDTKLGTLALTLKLTACNIEQSKVLSYIEAFADAGKRVVLPAGANPNRWYKAALYDSMMSVVTCDQSTEHYGCCLLALAYRHGLIERADYGHGFAQDVSELAPLLVSELLERRDNNGRHFMAAAFAPAMRSAPWWVNRMLHSFCLEFLDRRRDAYSFIRDVLAMDIKDNITRYL